MLSHSLPPVSTRDRILTAIVSAILDYSEDSGEGWREPDPERYARAALAEIEEYGISFTSSSQ